QCPLHKLIPNTSISVDAFNLGAISGCTAYFLSHFHSDHYGGLTSAWSHGPVYCNAITAALVRTQLKVDANLVVELPMNSWTTIQHCPNTMVYLFDANHAPGSAIFVFLIGTDSASDDTLPLVAGHTGDFRATYQHLQDIEVALSTAPVTDPSRLCIDWLYLDTTYFSDEYVFPLQEDVLSTIPQLPSDTRVLFVVGTYIIGKERVAESILTALDAVYGDRSLIYGDDKKCNLLKLLDGHPITADRLTNNPHIARVHIVSLVNITAKGMQQYSKTFGRMFDGIVAFKPTGWTFTQNFSSAKTATKANASSTAMRGDDTAEPFPKVTIFPLPYSEHSSFRDHALFAAGISRPIKRVVPTVSMKS
ncbi:DRMBL-domain-containing protein, partial [Ramicandelaber brevisporus]